jgi:hypothetical protein
MLTIQSFVSIAVNVEGLTDQPQNSLLPATHHEENQQFMSQISLLDIGFDTSAAVPPLPQYTYLTR